MWQVQTLFQKAGQCRQQMTEKECIYAREYYSAIKKNESLPSVTAWMGLESIMLSEKSRTERGKYLMISLISGV